VTPLALIGVMGSSMWTGIGGMVSLWLEGSSAVGRSVAFEFVVIGIGGIK
jgi:hypothetical protein